MPEQMLPRFLNHADLIALNEDLWRKTGCFAFLRPHSLLIHAENRTYRDQFMLLSIGLYVVYHDFGCQYLDFFLDDSNCPPSLPYPYGHRQHKNVILNTLRPAVAHGLLGDGAKNSFWTEIAKHYIQTLTPKQQGWSEYVDTVTEDQWEAATDRLKFDADTFYDFLVAWGDNHNANLRMQFAQSNRFRYSINRRVCESILKENGVSNKDLNKFLSSSTNPNPNIDKWRNILGIEYGNGVIKTADELYDRLCILINTDVLNATNAVVQSSLQSAVKYGFSIPASGTP